jgi:hypothetical protein
LRNCFIVADALAIARLGPDQSCDGLSVFGDDNLFAKKGAALLGRR